MSSPWDGPILERGQELESAEAALSAAANGEGTILLIEAPPGMGKTRLAEAIVDLADSSGFGVHRARGEDLEVGFAYGVLRQILRSMLEPLQPSDRAAVANGPGRLAASLLEDGANRRVGDALGIDYGFYRLLQDLAERHPRLLLLDDAHWADLRSLHALRFATRRLEEQSVVTVITYRPSRDGERTDPLRQLSLVKASRRLLLSPLGPEAVLEMARFVLGAEPDETFVHELQRVTGGNPFLVTELLAQARMGGSASGSIELTGQVPDRVTQSVQQRVTACGDSAVRLAEAVAILGEGYLRDVARLASLELAEAGVAADRLAAVHVLTVGRRLRFSHPLLRQAVVDRIPDSQRRLAHDKAGRVLADVGAPPEEIVAHLVNAPEQADPWIVELLVAEAMRELARGSPETAEPLLARARDEPPPPSNRFHVTSELARVRAQTGHPEVISTARQALELASDPSEQATATLHLIRTIGIYRGFRSASSLLAEVKASVDAVDPELALQLEAELLGLVRLDGESYQQAVFRLEELAPRATPARPSSVLLLANLAMSALERNEHPSKIAQLAELALSHGWLITEGNLQLLYAVASLIWIDELDAAARACGQIDEEARKRGSVSLSGLLYGLRAQLNLRRGSVSDAVADARVCAELAFSGAPTEGTAYARAHLADALMERAEWDEADRVLADPVPEERADLNPYYLNSRGQSSQARHDPAAALRNFTACGNALARRGGVDTPTIFPWRSHAAQAHMHLGDQDRARELAEEELELAETGRVPGAIGEVMTTLGMIEGGSEGERRIRAALDVLEESPRLLVRIRALTELGSMIRRQGRPAEARPILKSALDLAHRQGAVAREQRAHEELVLAGSRPRRSALTGVDALTPSERRVAQLVGKGLTNREIADTLFVSPRTISTHLTHIYQKLDTDDRDELSTLLPTAVSLAAGKAQRGTTEIRSDGGDIGSDT